MISFELSTVKLNAYRIRLSGDRRRFHAKNLREMQMALKHYFGRHGGGHRAHACPLCMYPEEA